MSQLLDLQVEIAARPPEASPETAAPITLLCETLKLKQEAGVFSYPLTKKERDDLRWYLEQYWKWPFEGFAQRGSTVEQLLPMLGQRLYQAVFKQGAARDIIQQWRADTTGAHQISIITTDAGALSLPWELLHDGQDFLALQANPPISIVRRIAEEQQPSPLTATFEKPLRVLLVTARPADEGQVDARIIAREVLDVLQDQIEAGTIELEFLRPPTFKELITRLSDTERPVHVLHFDGHGVFKQSPGSQDGNDEERGRLYFEKYDRKGDPVDAASLAEMLRYGGVQVVVLNACQSAAIGEKDIFSSVAVQLLQGSVQAVVAMSASVMTTSAALYVKAFYGALAAGGSVQAAHEQAQRALHEHPERNPFQRRPDEAGTPVILQDWWLPYLYLQIPLALQPVGEGPEPPSAAPRFNSALPAPPPHGFSGRNAELLDVEHSLLPMKDGARRIVVIPGFGGSGKTALACEAADWLTRTKMFATACFVSFEHGGGGVSLLNFLGKFLAINDGNYDPRDWQAALAILAPLLKKRSVLIIADYLESVLPERDPPLDDPGRMQLWDVLLGLAGLGAGVLITSRDTAFGDGRLAQSSRVAFLELKGLHPEEAYALATKLLTYLGIDWKHASYAELCDLLRQLDYHPLSIQLVLPVLREMPLSKIKADFAALLPHFKNDTATGRNRSLVASLEDSLRRLSEEQRQWLPRLALFEGGANEDYLLEITQTPEIEWAKLRQALEGASLLKVEQIAGSTAPFLHFHPVLAPYLRRPPGAIDASLRERYARRYFTQANYLVSEDQRHPQPARALMRLELPNMRRALELLLEAGDLDAASDMADCIVWFLNIFGLGRERDELRRRVAEAVSTAGTQEGGALTQAEWLRESGLGEEEYGRGDIRSAYARFTKLLTRIEALPEGTPLSRGSYEHCQTLGRLARCLRACGQPTVAEKRLREALAIIGALIKQQPEDQDFIRQCGGLLTELGNVLRNQWRYSQARVVYELALKADEHLNDFQRQAVDLGQLGTLALQQGDYVEAQSRHTAALERFRALSEPAMEAVAWHELGRVAEKQKVWAEAERCYRESLAIKERLGNAAGAAMTCNQLAIVARGAGRPAETEVWYKRALELDGRVHSNSPEQAKYFNNLADLLVNEVRASRVSKARLGEARYHAERALAIKETLDASSGIWKTLSILAGIAHLEGRAEEARGYRRREREAFAAFEGNRYHIDRQHGQLIADIADAAKGEVQARAKVEEFLPQIEAYGWYIAAATRIWAGEREWHSLVEDLDAEKALLVLRVLETIADPAQAPDRTLEEAIASLPTPIRDALERDDQAAFEQAFEALTPEEYQAVRVVMQALQAEQDQQEEERA